MGKNCLVTKFKSVVDNSNLPIYGHVKLLLTAKSGSPYVKMSFSEDAHVTCDGTLTLDGNTEMSFTKDTLTQCTVAGSGCLTIEDKYSLSYFESKYVNVSVALEDLCYTKITQFEVANADGNGVTGDISKFINNSPMLVDIRLNDNNNLIGNLADVKQSSLNELVTLNVQNSQVEGSLDLFSNGSLTRLGVNNCVNITGTLETLPNKKLMSSIAIYNSGVTGSIDAYVASIIEEGQTSGDKSVTGALTQLTFNGVKQDVSGISNIANCWIYWFNDGKIYVLTGGDTRANATHVFCKGYTQQEAEAAFSGKTIIRVDA